jgi:hypothetical protein
MALVDVKENAATKRFFLIRLRVRRYISRRVTSLGGSDYGITSPGYVAGLTINSTSLTLVTSLSGNNQYTFNPETNAVTLRLASAPNGTTQILCLDYHIFLTSGETLNWNLNPDSSSTARVEWLPRISQPPTVSQSISSVLDGGLFTFSAGTFSVSNADDYFNQFLTGDDSYKDAPTDVWFCIDDVTNRRKVFNGACQSLSVSDSFLSFILYDAFSPLTKPCFFGDIPQEAYFLRQSDSFPNVMPNQQDKPCPFIVGNASRFRIKPGLISLFQVFDDTSLPEAVCTNYNDSFSISVNREWGLFRTRETLTTAGINKTNLSAITYQVQSGGHYMTLTIPTADVDLENIDIGVTFKLTEAAKPTNYYRVTRLSQSGANTVIRLWTPGVAVNPTYTPAVTISNFPMICLNLVQGGITYELMYERDYTVSGTATSGGNTYYEANLVSNFESNVASSTLKPVEDKLYYCAYVGRTSSIPGTLLQTLLEGAGLTTDSTFDTQIDDILPLVYGEFSIPDFDEQDYPTYGEVCAKILRSILGYIRLSNTGVAQGYLFNTPTPGDIYTDSDILNLSRSIEYRDLASRVISFNPSDPQELVNTGSTYKSLISSSLTDESDRSKFLDRSSKDIRLRHVLNDISDRLEEITRLRSRPFVTYTFTTPTKAVEILIGDDIELQSEQVLGGTVDLKVIGLEFSIDGINVTGTPLEGLSATDI